jgi:aspartate dehydrogenase
MALLDRQFRVAVGGFGAIGQRVARALDSGMPGLVLSAISARDTAKAKQGMRSFAQHVPILPLKELAEVADIVVDAAPADALRAMAEPALRAGRKLIVISVGALLQSSDLIELARKHQAQIIVPSGALVGLDAVTAAAEAFGTHDLAQAGKSSSWRGTPRSRWRPNLEHRGADDCLQGTAAEAAVGFPENLNVAAALALAGIGPERTIIELWADPDAARNTHRIEVEADSASFSMMIGEHSLGKFKNRTHYGA